MALTSEQIAIVKSTAPILKEHGEVVTQVFYRNLLRDHPALYNYFSIRNQETGAQQTALAAAVFAYAVHIDNLAALSGAVQKIAHKHASLFVKPEHYPIVGEYLIGALAEVLGSGLTPEIKESWIAAYGQLAQVFIDTESSLYKAAGEWQGWRAFKIVRKVPESDSITSFYLQPSDGHPIPTYVPGQYVSVQVPAPNAGGVLQNRQFSLSEGPLLESKHYRITVKKENFGDKYKEEDIATGKSPGLVSSILHNKLSVGDEISLSPPRGIFVSHEDVLKNDSKVPIVLISAGVGATPLMSILERVVGTGNSSRPITWAHGARQLSGVCYGESVRDISRRNTNVTSKIFVKNVEGKERDGQGYDEEGRLDLNVLEGQNLLHLQDPSTQFYICGPEEFMLQVQDSLARKAVSADRIHIELFRTGNL